MKTASIIEPPVDIDSLLSVEAAAKEAGTRLALRFPLDGRLNRPATDVTYLELSGAGKQAAAQIPPGRRPVALVTSGSFTSLAVIYACLQEHTPLLLLSTSAPEAVRRQQIEAAGAAAVFDEEGFHRISTYHSSITYERGEQFLVPTSGTTAKAKIAVLTRSGVVASARASQKIFPLGPDSRWALTLPYCHVGGLSILMRALIARATVVARTWDFSSEDGYLGLVREGVTHVSLVPTQLGRLVRSNLPAPPTLKAALIGGAACPPRLRQVARAAGWPVVCTYGFTEASSQVCSQALGREVGPEPERDVGRPLPQTEVALDEKGRIAVRGPTLMSRYLGHPPLEKGAWFVTQDLGFWDSEDRLVLLGRADCTIVSGGENVSAERVEEALCATPFVEEAAVFGLPDEIWGERIVAIVAGRENSHQDLLAALKGELEPFALPKEIYFCTALPRLGSGKLDRRGARALLETLRQTSSPSPD